MGRRCVTGDGSAVCIFWSLRGLGDAVSFAWDALKVDGRSIRCVYTREALIYYWAGSMLGDGGRLSALVVLIGFREVFRVLEGLLLEAQVSWRKNRDEKNK